MTNQNRADRIDRLLQLPLLLLLLLVVGGGVGEKGDGETTAAAFGVVDFLVGVE